MFQEFLFSSSEAVQIENLLLSLKQRTKRKLADRDTDVDSQDSRDRDAFFQRVQTFSVSFYLMHNVKVWRHGFKLMPFLRTGHWFPVKYHMYILSSFPHMGTQRTENFGLGVYENDLNRWYLSKKRVSLTGPDHYMVWKAPSAVSIAVCQEWLD